MIELDVITIIIVLIILSILILAFTDKEKSIGEIVLHENYIIIITEDQKEEINLEKTMNLHILYIGHKGKLHTSDFVPKYNQYSDTDNYISFKYNEKDYSYKLFVESKEVEDDLNYFIKTWEERGYLDFRNLKFNN